MACQQLLMHSQHLFNGFLFFSSKCKGTHFVLSVKLIHKSLVCEECHRRNTAIPSAQWQTLVCNTNGGESKPYSLFVTTPKTVSLVSLSLAIYYLLLLGKYKKWKIKCDNCFATRLRDDSSSNSGRFRMIVFRLPSNWNIISRKVCSQFPR